MTIYKKSDLFSIKMTICVRLIEKSDLSNPTYPLNVTLN